MTMLITPISSEKKEKKKLFLVGVNIILSPIIQSFDSVGLICSIWKEEKFKIPETMMKIIIWRTKYDNYLTPMTF